MTIEDQLRSLTPDEVTILEYRCQGLTIEAIAIKMEYGIDWVQLHMGFVYQKLGFDKKMHWTHRIKILQKEVCPALANFREEIPLVPPITAGNVEEPQTTMENRAEPEMVDPEIMALVLYDEKMLRAKEKKEGVIILDGGQKPNSIVRFFRILFSLVVGALVLSGVAYVSFYFGRNSAPKPAVEIAVTNSVVTVTVSSSLPATQTDIPPTQIPTAISTNTDIPIPTVAEKPYYEESEAVTLRDGIYMSLHQDFLRDGGVCGVPRPGFGVRLVIENTISQQFLVRFNSGGFHAVDDLGNPYKLVAIGNNGDGFCDDPIGVPLEYTMSSGYWTSYIPMQFQGQMPLEATYFLITADWISGIGPIVFKKNIY